tara:strand:- start:347 stop:1126 length:780 start_codon:yes stop_codon:yes gene_type:complete
MNPTISSICYCPVKSVSFQNIYLCEIKKKLGITNDRIFAFSRNIDLEKAKLIEKDAKERKLNYFLTLKNSPVLNKYNFVYENNTLTLNSNNKDIISISADDPSERLLLANKLMELENSLLKPITLLKNADYPFFDTSHSKNIFNSMSLINLSSIKDLENKIKEKIEPERFRANFYIDGIDPWEERNWIGKTIKINNVSFKVEKNIPRCVAINLKPKTDDNSLNLLKSLKKSYNHFDMGIYLVALEDGKIEIGNKIELKI